jgi:hypothetical protein
MYFLVEIHSWVLNIDEYKILEVKKVVILQYSCAVYCT